MILLDILRTEDQYGVEFEFYLYNEAMKLLKAKDINNPTSKVSGKGIKQLLKPYKVSAKKALELYYKKIKVGHTVHLFRGTKQI